MSVSPPRLYVVCDRGVFGDDREWLDALAEMAVLLQPGEALQVRAKLPPGPERRALLVDARKVVARARVPVLLNGTRFQAADLDYSALHLPEANLTGVGDTRTFDVTAASIHSVESLRSAEASKLDFVVAGAIFAPGSHPGEGRGLAWLAEMVRQAHIPVLAIGGITPASAASCMDAGAAGVAIVTGILLARDRRSALDAYRAAVSREPEPRPAGEPQ